MRTFLLWSLVGAGVMAASNLLAGDPVDPLTIAIGGAVLGGVAAGAYYFAGDTITTAVVPILLASGAFAAAPNIKRALEGPTPSAGGA